MQSITADPAAEPLRTALCTGEAGLIRGGRPLKRWRYVGVFGERFMACAALVQVGPARQSFWALQLRDSRELRERTRLLPRTRELQLRGGEGQGASTRHRDMGASPLAADTRTGTLRLRDRGVALELELLEDAGIEAFCRNGRGHVWTRKQAGVLARGTLAIDGEAAQPVQARAVIDDTAGYHPRRTEWWWSAGVGTGADGTELAWNLVSGVNDPATGSERSVWAAGEPREAAPVQFDADLSRILAEDGSELHFHAEAERAHSQNLLLVKSDYRAPFGTFSGTLPGGVELAHGLGVVEHHRALW